MRDARDRYLAASGYRVEGYTDPVLPVTVGPLVLRFRNPGLLPWHDLHHVATGFGTGLVGEARISAFELRAGAGSARVAFLCAGSVALGLLLAPRLVWRAWRRSRGARSLYGTAVPYERLLAMTVRELREHMGLPPEGLA